MKINNKASKPASAADRVVAELAKIKAGPNDTPINLERYENGRESGYLASRAEQWWTAAFAENRNSDNIVVYPSEHEMRDGDELPDQAWADARYFDPNDEKGAAAYIAEFLKTGDKTKGWGTSKGNTSDSAIAIRKARTEAASIKLEEEEFNGCAGRAKVIEQIDQIFGANRWTAYDSERKYWQNATDTLVIAIPNGSKLNRTAAQEVETGNAWKDLSADEIDEYTDRQTGATIIRFWWD